MAYVAVNDPKDGQPQLEQAVADLGDDAPNPLAYRTYTALAQLALANNDSKTAHDDLDKVLSNLRVLPADEDRQQTALDFIQTVVKIEEDVRADAKKKSAER